MIKNIYRYADVKDRILKAVDMIADPIRRTLSPKGSNVIYEDDLGNQYVTNDGITIAKNIHVKGDVENAIVEIIKGGSLRTNTEAGDGTSTTILLSSVLTKEGIRLLEDGHNPMELKKTFEDFKDKIIEKLKKEVREIKTDDDLFHIATISANNDTEIAKDVVKIAKSAGTDGHVIIDRSYSGETEIIEESGFFMETGYFTPELLKDQKQMFVKYKDVPVLITDKRLYYEQEAETILKTVLDNGYSDVVIVAKDFIGEALPFFVANHQQGSLNVLLIKDPTPQGDNTLLDDLALYLGGKVISEKNGSIVDNLRIEDFVLSTQVIANPGRTILGRNKTEHNPKLAQRINTLKKELKRIGNKESAEYKDTQKRIASMTAGMVTVKVGGATNLEIRENIFRFEDSINATRAAMKDGYLVGGGVALFRAFKQCKLPNLRVFKMVAEANIRQIAENCGLHPDQVVETIAISDDPNMGYNALTGRYEDLLEAGVVDPYKATEMAIENAVSIANVIVSSTTLIVNNLEELKENGKSKTCRD